MFNRSGFDNERPGGIAVLEIQTAEESAAPRLFVPLQRSELRGEIVGPLADLRLTQVFRFSRTDLDKIIEAVYRFPLPGDAAVQGVRVRFGDVEIQTELRERAEAEKAYARAKEAGQQAALMTRESPDVFTLAVAGIRPDEDVTVETHYVQLARAEGDTWTLRAPLTTAPRYVRSDEATGRHAQGQPLLVMRDPGHRFSLDLTVRGTGNVTSQTHALAVEPCPDGLRIRLQKGEVVPDRDLALRWKWEAAADQPTLRVWTHRDSSDPYVYFLALVAPAASPTRDVKPREITLLVDRSGSMSGPKWEAAQWAGSAFLNGLTSQDVFALCLFDDRQEWLAKKLQPANEQESKSAVDFLNKASARGGTELGVALEQALRLARTKGDVARHLLIVTDAQVSDSDRVLRLVDDEARQKTPRRVSVLCIDAAPNSYLVRELADRSGGIARFLTSNPREGDITTALEEVLEDWAAPLFLNMRLEVDREGVVSGHGASLPNGGDGHSALALGDLPAGRPVWIVGRAPAAESSDMSFRAVGDGHILAETPATAAESSQGQPAIKALFGAERLNRLEGLAYAGYQPGDLPAALARLGYADADIAPSAPPALYAENAREAVRDTVNALLVHESLASGLPCAETAFVAIRRYGEEAVTELALAVGNALPEEWSENFLTPTAAAPRVMAMSNSLPSSTFVRGFKKMSVRAYRDDAAPRRRPEVTLFSGTPRFSAGQAILFDEATGQPAAGLRDANLLAGLAIDFSDGAPSAVALDDGLTLKLYVGDRVTPRVSVRLDRLVRGGGRRPLNIQRRQGEHILLVLEDPNGAWAAAAPAITVTIEVQ
ncbi:MAG: VIT and VWA domain-containing protein [Anaerolineae bacterium]